MVTATELYCDLIIIIIIMTFLEEELKDSNMAAYATLLLSFFAFNKLNKHFSRETHQSLNKYN